MADIKRLEARDYGLDEIIVGTRLRPASAAGVAAVRDSLQEVGHIVSPVWLRRTTAGYELIDGLHRLEAARAEGFDDIPGIAFRCSARQARLLEIDGNLAGAELSPLDTAVFLAERKRLYEEKHPETRRGGDRRSPAFMDQTDTESVRSFAAVTAEKFGITERHVRRMFAAGASLAPDEVRRLRAAPAQVTLKDLQAIAGIGSAPERYHVVAALAEGRVKGAAAARAEWKAIDNGSSAPVKDPVEEAFRALSTAWRRAPMAARRRFAEDHAADLADLLATANGGAE